MAAAVSETVAAVALETGLYCGSLGGGSGGGGGQRRDCGDGGGVRGGHGAGAAIARDDSEPRSAGRWKRRVTGRSTRPVTPVIDGERDSDSRRTSFRDTAPQH